jgi:hypothetical protein
MIASLNPPEETMFVALDMRVRKQFGRDILKPGKVSQMHSGKMLSILCKETEVFLSGYSRVLMTMANDQKLQAAIFLRSGMEGYLSKILIGRIDH